MPVLLVHALFDGSSSSNQSGGEKKEMGISENLQKT